MYVCFSPLVVVSHTILYNFFIWGNLARYPAQSFFFFGFGYSSSILIPLFLFVQIRSTFVLYVEGTFFSVVPAEQRRTRKIGRVSNLVCKNFRLVSRDWVHRQEKMGNPEKEKQKIRAKEVGFCPIDGDGR